MADAFSESTGLKYHKQAFELLGESPVFSADALESISALERDVGIKFSASVVEYLCVDPYAVLFEKVSGLPHYFARVSELLGKIKKYKLKARWTDALEIIWENQGVHVMVVDLAESDDPQVWWTFREDLEDVERIDWKVHARSFCDCIAALFWDYQVMESQGQAGFLDAAELPNIWSGSTDGPTTFDRNAWIKCPEFRRFVINGRRVTLLGP